MKEVPPIGKRYLYGLSDNQSEAVRKKREEGLHWPLGHDIVSSPLKRAVTTESFKPTPSPRLAGGNTRSTESNSFSLASDDSSPEVE
jgi:hypothetical protein